MAEAPGHTCFVRGGAGYSPFLPSFGALAQLGLEHRAFNPGDRGPIPLRATIDSIDC